MSQERLVAHGREADIYACGPGRVRRVYRDGRAVTREVAVMQWLQEVGYPVPSVRPEDSGAMVMERIDGPTLAEAMLSGTCSARLGADVMTDLHARLHALPAPAAPGAPVDSAPGTALLHLDLHPLNVLLRDADPARPVVIDWSSTAFGEPGLDLALSAVMVAQIRLTPDLLPGPGAPPAGALLEEYLGRFLLGGARPSPAHVRAAGQRRAADPHLTAQEQAAVQGAVDLVLGLLAPTG